MPEASEIIACYLLTSARNCLIAAKWPRCGSSLPATKDEPMLRLLTFLSALFFASAAAATTLWVDAPRDGFLNLRTGPSTHYQVIGKMPHASKVELLRAPGKWVKVRHVSGRVGWAHSRFLSDHRPRGHGHGGHYGGNDRGQPYWVDAPRHGHLNLRSGPSGKHHVIDKMAHGDALRVLDKDGKWYKVFYRGKVGYAHRRFLSAHKVDAGHGKGPGKGHGHWHDRDHAGQTYYVYAPGYAGLNLRNGPGTDYPVVMTMHQRDRVTELGRQGKWILLRHASGKTGWAHGDYLVNGDPGYVAPPNAGRHDGHRDNHKGGGWDRDDRYGHGGGRRNGKTYDNFADAVTACVGRSGQDMQLCVLRNLGKID
ncbi:hypothetical protein CDZ97_00545 [Mameliella alba]|nr:hypothetical protein CDZ95_19035 [Mameliella alba]OWV68294.1 hypothetical protein CDZ97_00545 [Mameliella alba]